MILFKIVFTVIIVKLSCSVDKQSIQSDFYTSESDACMRQCCGPSRSFVMHITDNLGRVSEACGD
jgi:hypothetical protein